MHFSQFSSRSHSREQKGKMFSQSVEYANERENTPREREKAFEEGGRCCGRLSAISKMLLMMRIVRSISTSATNVLLYKNEQEENVSQFRSEIAIERSQKT